MDEILEAFRDEAKDLVASLEEILEMAEENIANRSQLEQFGQIVDRIMGGAKNLALTSNELTLSQIASCAEICKIVGYRGSQIEKDKTFYTIVVAFLLDATEILSQLIDKVGSGPIDDILKKNTAMFVDRLRWISGKFDETYRSSVAVEVEKKPPMAQNEIDALLKQLGIG